MADHCLVISGEWSCSDDGKWEFTIDKQQMSRVVPVRVGITLNELHQNVLAEFFSGDQSAMSVTLSYWPPNSNELATGLTTPPVLLTNEGAIGYFFKHFQLNSYMNLFAKFNEAPTKNGDSVVDDNGIGYTTPTPQPKKKFDLSPPSFCLRSGDGLASASTAGSKMNPLSLADEALLDFVDLDEQNKRNESHHANDSWLSDDAEVTDSEDEGVREVNIEDVRPRGYDNEFWEPLLDDDYGGSNAPDIICGIDDPSAASIPPKETFCTTNEASDHVVVPGSPMPEWKKEYDAVTTSIVAGLPPSSIFGPRSVPPNNHHHTPEHLRRSTWSSPTTGQQTSPTRTAPDPARTSTRKSSTWSSPTVYPRSPPSRPGTTFTHSPSTWSSPTGHPPSSGPRRTLDSVDDEEFDIAPMVDDTQYSADAIPDLDLDATDDEISVGKVYATKEDCRITLAIYAIKNRFCFKQTRTKRHYFVLNCADSACHWRVRARELTECGYYEIHKADLQHTCTIDTRNNYKKRATSTVIAAVFRSKYGDPITGPKAGELQQLLLEDLRVSASYMKCYRAKEKAITSVRGPDDDSYLKLPQYLHMLKHANPGTVTHLETETDENGLQRFLYLFLAFGSSIVGFRKLRPVLVIDGTHLSGKFKGVLLTASGQDANFQVFPLAFAVVDSENDEAWTWFLQKLERIIADSPNLTIISDRHSSIYTAKKIAFPQAHHGSCIVHLMRNVNSRYKSKGLAKLVGKAAFAFRVGGFREVFNKVRTTNPACAKYLEKIGIAHWSRAYFSGQRYNMMTSNVAEQLNKALRKARSSPIIELLMYIQRMLSRWFCARRKKSLASQGSVTPEVDKVITNNMTSTKGSRINSVSSWSCEVVGVFGQKHHVLLDTKVCTCRVYEKYKIPCGHALLAADSLGIPHHQLVGDCYKKNTWVETYKGFINPDGSPDDEELPDLVRNMVLMPPRTRRPSGRPKEKRIPSTGEVPVTKKAKLVPNKCGRCGAEGHNRTTCKNPI